MTDLPVIIPPNPLPLVFSESQWEVFFLKEVMFYSNKDIARLRKSSESVVRDHVRFYRMKIHNFKECIDVFYNADCFQRFVE